MSRDIAPLTALLAVLCMMASSCSPRVENEQLSDEALEDRAADLSVRADALVAQRLDEIEDKAPGTALSSSLLTADGDTP